MERLLLEDLKYIFIFPTKEDMDINNLDIYIYDEKLKDIKITETFQKIRDISTENNRIIIRGHSILTDICKRYHTSMVNKKGEDIKMITTRPIVMMDDVEWNLDTYERIHSQLKLDTDVVKDDVVEDVINQYDEINRNEIKRLSQILNAKGYESYQNDIYVLGIKGEDVFFAKIVDGKTQSLEIVTEQENEEHPKLRIFIDSEDRIVTAHTETKNLEIAE